MRKDLKSAPLPHLHFLGGLTLTRDLLAYHYRSGAVGIYADCEMVDSYGNASELQTACHMGKVCLILFIHTV